MKNLLIILTLLVVGCATKQQTSSTQISENKPSIIEINLIEGESILFTIKNTTTESVYIYQPQKLHIEKFNNGSWERLKILPCPCGAPCAKPPESVEILSLKDYTWSWDRNESWCGDKNEMGIPETIKTKVLNGKYRLRILYGINSKQKETIYKEFELK